MDTIHKTRKLIGRQMSCYFKSLGYTQKDVAEIMNISPQTVANHTHGVAIGKKLCDAYFLAFGFEPEYLLTGKGELIKKASGYQKLKRENEMLRALVKAQRIALQRFNIQVDKI